MILHKQVHIGYDPITGKRIRKWFHASTEEKLEQLIAEYKMEFKKAIDSFDTSFRRFDIEDESSVNVPNYVYFILNEEKDKVKIGITRNLNQRCKSLQTACGEELELLHSIKFKSKSDALNAERALHLYFSKYRKHPIKENRLTQITEWFDGCIVPELMNSYEKIIKEESK